MIPSYLCITWVIPEEFFVCLNAQSWYCTFRIVRLSNSTGSTVETLTIRLHSFIILISHPYIGSCGCYKKYCKITISNYYKHIWLLEVTNLSRNPILRTYSMFKTEFRFEKYLEAITDCRYRTAMTKLRSSSHTLEIERGRYTKPKTDISERLCPLCNAVEDGINFLINFKLYEAERLRFFSNLMTKIRNFNELDDVEKFILLMSSEDNQIVTWTGKFIYKSFNIRSRFYLNCSDT